MLPNSVAVWIYTHSPLIWVLHKTSEGEIVDNLYYVVYPTPDDPPSFHYGPYGAMHFEPTIFGGRGSEFFNSYVVYPSPSP